jgi:hypothetical protein
MSSRTLQRGCSDALVSSWRGSLFDGIWLAPTEVLSYEVISLAAPIGFTSPSPITADALILSDN